MYENQNDNIEWLDLIESIPVLTIDNLPGKAIAGKWKINTDSYFDQIQLDDHNIQIVSTFQSVNEIIKDGSN